MAKYLVEFIGTFFLVATIGFTVVEPVPGEHGAAGDRRALMVMVFAAATFRAGTSTRR